MGIYLIPFVICLIVALIPMLIQLLICMATKKNLYPSDPCDDFRSAFADLGLPAPSGIDPRHAVYGTRSDAVALYVRGAVPGTRFAFSDSWTQIVNISQTNRRIS